MKEVRFAAITLYYAKSPTSTEFRYLFYVNKDYADLIHKLRTGSKNQVQLRISKPFKPRSTGYRSQNHRFRGQCGDISKQVDGFTPAEVARIMKGLAVGNGYPTKTLGVNMKKHKKVTMPESEANLSVEQEDILIKTVQEFADRNEYWLTEYTKDKPPRAYHAVGGRSETEMEVYWKQIQNE